MKETMQDPTQDSNHVGQVDDLNSRQLLKYARDLANVYKQEKEKRRSLEASKEKIEAIIAGMSNGMLATDMKHAIIEANPVACKLLEISHDQLIGRNFLEMPGNAPIKEKLMHLAGAAAAPEENMLELELPNRRQVRIFISRLKTDQGFVYIIRDITSEKRAEEAKKTLLGIISHELRTPLASILNFTQVLTAEFSDDDSSTARQYLERILQNGLRLENTINDLLQFVQLEKEHIEISDSDEFRIDDILQETLNILQPEISDRNINVKTSIETASLPLIKGSPQLLINMFTQIIHNAVIYSSQNGEVNIRITELGDKFITTVEDRGAGIPAVEIDKIFSGFYQVQDHESGGYEGLGLGLSIAKRIAEHHNGVIKMNSEVGRGTKCIITLPRKP